MLLHIATYLRPTTVMYVARSVQASVDRTFWAIAIFAVFLAVLALAELAQGGLKEFFVITQAIACVLAPRIIGEALHAPLPRWVELGIALHVALTLLGGEIMYLYERIWWWDIAPHVLAGFLAAFIAAFAFVQTFGLPESTKRRVLIGVVAFAASVGFSGVWEIYEFSADVLFGTTMQPSAADTMHDLAVCTIGALLVVLLPYRLFTARS